MKTKFPETAEGCLAERAEEVNQCRKIANKATEESRDLTAEESTELSRRMERARNCKAEADRLNGVTITNRGTTALAELEEMEEELNRPLNRRRTTGSDRDERHTENFFNHNDDLLAPGQRRIQWNLGDRRTRSGRQVNRSLIVGGRRSQDDYRRHAQNYLAGGERQILGPDGKPYFDRNGNGPSNVLTTIQVGDDTRAGYFVLPEQMTAEILRTVDDEVWIQQWATVTYLSNARSLGIRRRTAKANSFNWGSELSDATDNLENALAYGKRVLEPHYITGSFRVSRMLLRMAEINMEAEIISEMMIDYREFLEAAYMTGNGNQRPLGLLTASADGISTARDIATGSSSTAATFNSYAYAKYMLKPRYRRNSFWLMHPDKVRDLSLLRSDSGAGANTGQYLWQPSRQVGEPDVLLGIPVRESYWMPTATGTGNYFAIIGDMSFYRIVIGLEMEMQRLTETRAKTNEFEYIFRSMIDAAPVMEEAFVRMAYGT